MDIFYKWGNKGFKKAYIRLARDSLRNALSEFNAIDVLENSAITGGIGREVKIQYIEEFSF